MAGQGLNPLGLGDSENLGSSESESTTTDSILLKDTSGGN